MASALKNRWDHFTDNFFQIGRRDDGGFFVELRESYKYRQAALEAFFKSILWIVTFPTARQKKWMTIIAVIAATYVLQRKASAAHRKAINRQNAREKRLETSKAKLELLQKVTTTDKDVLAKREDILKLTLSELSASLKSGQYSPVEVLHAYQAKAMECTCQANCVTEPVAEAEEWAKELEQDEDKKGLLYGVPVSIKENIHMKGYDVTLGFGKFVHQPVPDDSVVVQILKQQGAIPFVRTNVPQMLLSMVSSNPVYGETVNPVNPERSPGGSSGGEAALIALNGSILGIGTDILGSVRIPSHFCGIYGIKPTHGRISSLGSASAIPGQKSVSGSVGVMAQDVDSVVLGMKALLVPEMFALDKTVIPIPFQEQVYSDGRKLRIGYYDYDNFVIATPPCRRAVAMAKDALEKAGHTLIPFKPPGMDDVYEHPLTMTFQGAFADNFETLKTYFQDEDMDPLVGVQLKTYFLPSFLKRIAQFVFGFWSYIQETLTTWKDSGIDVMICPVLAIPACKSEEAGDLTFVATYCSLYNLLNFPAGSVPVTTVTEADDEEMKNFPQRDRADKLTIKAMKDSVGLPVGVQCVAPPWQEELCLKLMKELEKAIK
ncbi:vitamin D3 hydroxylase-associated protein-like [Glandiceps talaboti]